MSKRELKSLNVELLSESTESRLRSGARRIRDSRDMGDHEIVEELEQLKAELANIQAKLTERQRELTATRTKLADAERVAYERTRTLETELDNTRFRAEVEKLHELDAMRKEFDIERKQPCCPNGSESWVPQSHLMTCTHEPVHKSVMISSTPGRESQKHPKRSTPLRQLVDPKRLHLALPTEVSTSQGQEPEGVTTVGIATTSRETSPKRRVHLKLPEDQAKCLLSQRRTLLLRETLPRPSHYHQVHDRTVNRMNVLLGALLIRLLPTTQKQWDPCFI